MLLLVFSLLGFHGLGAVSAFRRLSKFATCPLLLNVLLCVECTLIVSLDFVRVCIALVFT